MKIIVKCESCNKIDFEFSDNGDYLRCKNCGESIFIEDCDIYFTCEDMESGR